MLMVESTGITDIGRKRKANEDSYLIDDELGLYVLADGMGGHRAGDVASRTIVQVIYDYLKKKTGNSNEQQKNQNNLSENASRLLSAIKAANKKVYTLSLGDNALQGMGSTVSALHIKNRTFIAANVGDSPIYLVHKNQIELVCAMHTVMAEYQHKDPALIKKLGPRCSHILTRAVGTKKSVQAYLTEGQVFRDDILIICSDGLTDKLSEEEIRDIVLREEPGKASRVLVDLANSRGGEDNITIIIVKFFVSNKFLSWILKLKSRIIGIIKQQGD